MNGFLSKLTILLFVVAAVVPAQSATAGNSKNTVTMSLTGEPPDLNSMRATDTQSGFVLGHIMQGLTSRDKTGKIVPGVAESWKLDATTATFKLRKNAKWSDGKPVTAHDFVFAWQTVVDPATASKYAFILYPIKNAEAINTNKDGKKASDLGVKAVDDYTLEVAFDKPCAYFLSLAAFSTYYPVRKDFYLAQDGGKKFAADAKNLIFNGPFKLDVWEHGSKMKMTKNEFYWNKETIKMDVIDIPYFIIDAKARYNLYKDKKIDMVGLDSETFKESIKDSFKANRFADGSVFYLEFNHRPERVTRNIKLREAIRSIYNAKEVVDKVIALPGNEPAYTLFPKWLRGVGRSFRQEYPVKSHKVDFTQAKKLLEEAKKELGLTQLPPIWFLVDDGAAPKRQAEYVQGQLKKHLGLDMNIDIQTFKQRLSKMSSGDFDIVAAGWGPDYDDPMTFADLFTSWNENNRGKYANPEYDKVINEAMTTIDAKKRMDAMGKAQDILIRDVVILPQYERGIVYLQNQKLKGVVRSVVGADPNFIFASVE